LLSALITCTGFPQKIKVQFVKEHIIGILVLLFCQRFRVKGKLVLNNRSSFLFMELELKSLIRELIMTASEPPASI
jgi:hypothetical protein